MLIKRPSDVRSSEITPKEIYLNRRTFMKEAAVTGAVLAASRVLCPPWEQAFPRRASGCSSGKATSAPRAKN